MAAAAQAAEARISAFAGRSANIARQGVDTVTAAMRIISDLTAQELSMVIGMMRERISMRPAASLVGMGGRAMMGVIGAEKILLDLAAGETAIVVEGLKEGLKLRPSIAAVVDIVPKGVHAYAEMGKSFLDDTVEQTQDFVDAYTEGKPLMIGDRMKKFTRQRVEAFVETQKKFLDEVNEQVTIATEGGEEAAAGERSLAQIAREGVDKFIDAEKKVLHLAIANIEATRPRERAKPPKTSFAQMTQKSVHNLTNAQKSLLDLAMKPIVDGGAQPRAAQAPRARKAAPRKAAARRAKKA